MKQRKVLMPPKWVVAIFCVVGVYATSLIYNSVVHGGWVSGIIGGAMLAGALYITASPLAASMWKHRMVKSNRGKVDI